MKKFFFITISVIFVILVTLLAQGCAGGSSGGSGSGGSDPVPSPTATVTPTGSVVGTVMAGNVPLGGATCTITTASAVFSDFSDEMGKFELNGIPVGTHNLQVTATGYDPITIVVEIIEGQTTSCEVGMGDDPNPSPTPTEVGNLRGRIIDSNGNPVNGATVRVDVTDSRPTFYASTDSSGSYVVYNVPVGTWPLVAYKGDFSSTTTVMVVEGETVTVPDQVIVANPSPSPDPTASPTATPTGSPSPSPTGTVTPSPSPTASPTPGEERVQGDVKDRDTNESLGNVEIQFKQGETTIKTISSDENGNFSVNLPAGSYRAELRLTNYRVTSFPITVTSGVNEFHFTMKKL